MKLLRQWLAIRKLATNWAMRLSADIDRHPARRFGQCVQCGTALAETGAPIWEAYCPNKACDYERKQMFANVRAARERREREEYERLKAKFGPASADGRRMAETENTDSVPQGTTSATGKAGDAQ